MTNRAHASPHAAVAATIVPYSSWDSSWDAPGRTHIKFVRFKITNSTFLATFVRVLYSDFRLCGSKTAVLTGGNRDSNPWPQSCQGTTRHTICQRDSNLWLSHDPQESQSASPG